MGPIRGQTRPLPVAVGIVPEAQRINAKMNASIHNRFDVEVVDAVTGKVKQQAQAENVVCAGYWQFLFGAQKNYIDQIAYGSGSGTPAESDTVLFTALGYKSTSWKYYKTDDSNYYFKASIQLSETENVGATLSEIGLLASSGSILCTHAMLKDMNGNAITIAKTATDIINIYATVFLRLNLPVWLSFVETTNEAKYAFFAGIAGLTLMINNDYSSGSFSSSSTFFGPDGSAVNGIAWIFSQRPSSTQKSVTLQIPRLAATLGNLAGGISKIRIRGSYSGSVIQDIFLQLPGDWYSGSDIVGEAIGTGDGTTTAFATDFVHATNATIYVNGVAQSGVTVTDASTVTNNIVFATAPASGAVITADYHTSVIAKDVNHVFDFSVTFNFGEYTG